MEAEETSAELCARKGVVITTVRSWMKKGMPSTLRQAPNSLKKERRFVPSKVDKWLKDRNAQPGSRGMIGRKK